MSNSENIGRTVQVHVHLDRPLHIVDTNSDINKLKDVRKNPCYGTLIMPHSLKQKAAGLIHHS